MLSLKTFSENARGILFMLATTVGFILSDTFIKLASEGFSVGQSILVRSLIAAPAVILLGWRQGAFRNLRSVMEPFLGLRLIGEVGAAATYLTALARMDIANSTAIIQIVPLAATAAGAIFLGEKVGVRRWSAIAAGFLAVLLIIRPGPAGFNAWSLLALIAVIFIVLRDLSSRALPLTTHPLTPSAMSIVAMIPLGLAMLPFEFWAPLTVVGVLYCALSGAFLAISFVLITLAMRYGELAVVQPFRYAVLLWAVIIQIVVFSVWPDALTLIGIAMLVATGLYTFYRETKRKRENSVSRQSTPAAISAE
jgi:drug/metabolite transporter (DMT)-like permease